LGGRGYRRRIEATAHEHGDAPCPQAIAHGRAKELAEMRDVICATPIFEFRRWLERPIPRENSSGSRPNELVRRGEPPNLCKAGRGGIQVTLEEQEVADRLLVQLIADSRMQAHAPERVAEYQSVGHLRVEKWLYAEAVPRTQQTFLRAIPDREREVPD